MKPFWKTKSIQLRLNEPLGNLICPYAYRWVFIFFGYSIRIHHFLRSDSKDHFHDHAWFFITFVIKGFYIDVSEDENRNIIKQIVKPFRPTYRSANHKHYVKVPKCGVWTILFTGRPIRKWGFWVNGKLKRPLKYFHKFGHPPCDTQ